MTIKRSLAAARRNNLRGVFDIAATNKPAEFILTHSVAAKFANSHRKFPSIAASVLCVVPRSSKTMDGTLSQLRRTSMASTIRGKVACFVQRYFLEHPVAPTRLIEESISVADPLDVN